MKLKRRLLRSMAPVVFAAFAAASPSNAEEPPLCGTLLMDADLKAAVDRTFDRAEPTSDRADHSICSWSYFGQSAGTEDFPVVADIKTIDLRFSGPRAIRDGLIQTDTMADFFDMSVESEKEVSGSTPAKLDDVGTRAVIFAEGQRAIVFLETPAGVAHLTTDGLERQQVEALATAVARRAMKK